MDDSSSALHDDITDVPGITVGHAENMDAKTGVTVILTNHHTTAAGVHIGGGASSTRQMDSLRPNHLVDRVHGICFAGGSAFGLDATGGVLEYLERAGIGMPVTGRLIPIVPSAVIFDLNFGRWSVRPDRELGFRACENASPGPVRMGSVGAGTGATVGKLKGIEHAMKGGLGSASSVSDDLVVGALVVVNAYGDITDARGTILAGLRIAPDSLETGDAARLLREGKAVTAYASAENTTLALVAVNARLDKTLACRIAAQATLGMGSVISPFHTPIDGDLTIVLGVGEHEVDPNRIGLLAADALQRAVIKGIQNADGFGILPAYKDLCAAADL